MQIRPNTPLQHTKTVICQRRRFQVHSKCFLNILVIASISYPQYPADNTLFAQSLDTAIQIEKIGEELELYATPSMLIYPSWHQHHPYHHEHWVILNAIFSGNPLVIVVTSCQKTPRMTTLKMPKRPHAANHQAHLPKYVFENISSDVHIWSKIEDEVETA